MRRIIIPSCWVKLTVATCCNQCRLSWFTLTLSVNPAIAPLPLPPVDPPSRADLTSYNFKRVVVQALLYAAQMQKKRFRVYVTESRPVRFPSVAGSPLVPTSTAANPPPRMSLFQFGLGLKTHALLTAAGIESVVVLDSAVAYVMAKVSSQCRAVWRTAEARRLTFCARVARSTSASLEPKPCARAVVWSTM